MPKIVDLDFSIQMACKLLNASLQIGNSDVKNRLAVYAENDDLKFALDFIESEIPRLLKVQRELPIDVAITHFEVMTDLTLPLKQLKTSINNVLGSTSQEKRELFLRLLLDETMEIESKANQRIEKIRDQWPELLARRRPGSTGSIPADDVLHAIQKERKSEQNKNKLKA